ncbi:hypothetical protein [Sporomusa aerivorans]|uniref:hypothetical protein n=1 Tax=Sporomusa aerivorans TaxID=204936 RepID=UPI00352AD7AE
MLPVCSPWRVPGAFIYYMAGNVGIWLTTPAAEAAAFGLACFLVLIESITFAWIRATSDSTFAKGSAQAVFSL